jgi:hypothetical protein
MGSTSDNDVSRLDIEVSNPIFVKKCNTVHQLPAKIGNLAIKVTKIESKIKRSSFRSHDERPNAEFEHFEQGDYVVGG